MNSERGKKILFILNLAVILILIWAFYNQYSRANKLKDYSEAANRNTLYTISSNLDHVYLSIEHEIYGNDRLGNSSNSEIILLHIQEDIRDIEVIARSFVCSDNQKYAIDPRKIQNFSIGLYNYFQDINALKRYSPEKKEQLLSNLYDLRYKLEELYSNNEYSTEECLHYFIEYVEDYDGWEKGLKRKIDQVYMFK